MQRDVSVAFFVCLFHYRCVTNQQVHLGFTTTVYIVVQTHSIELCCCMNIICRQGWPLRICAWISSHRWRDDFCKFMHDLYTA